MLSLWQRALRAGLLYVANIWSLVTGRHKRFIYAICSLQIATKGITNQEAYESYARADRHWTSPHALGTAVSSHAIVA